MYYTAYQSEWMVKRAGMDGSNPTKIVSGSSWGITTDFKISKLFWAHCWNNKIESSGFQGEDRRTVVNGSMSCPTGIAVSNGRIYWGEASGRKLKSSTLTGEDVITLYNGSYIRGVAMVPDLNLPQNRMNHCARHNCTKVCVLTASSHRCLS